MRDSLFELYPWFVTGRTNLRRVAGEVAHFAGTKFTARFRFDVDLEQLRQNLRHFANRDALAAARVHGKSVELVGFSREQIRARDVLDEREIASLLAILVENRREIVQQTGAENRDDTGVRIENRLARPVSARITERDGWDADLFSPKQHEFFLIDFR